MKGKGRSAGRQDRILSSDIAACYLRFAISLQIGLPIEENLASYSVIILPDSSYCRYEDHRIADPERKVRKFRVLLLKSQRAAGCRS